MSAHHNLPKVVYSSYLSLINKDTSQAVTFIGSSLQGKYLGSLFHYTQHLHEVENFISQSKCSGSKTQSI